MLKVMMDLNACLAPLPSETSTMYITRLVAVKPELKALFDTYINSYSELEMPCVSRTGSVSPPITI